MLPDDATRSAEDPDAAPGTRPAPVADDALPPVDAPQLDAAPPPDPTAQPDPAVDESLDPAWAPAELVAYRLVLAPLVLGASAIAAGFGAFRLVPVLGSLAGGLALFWILQRLARALVARQFAATRWSVTDAHLRIQRGVWWRKEIHVPRSRIQHTDVTQGPLQRHYGVATFVVHTAGTTYATVSLEGLAHARAQALRDRLVVGDGDDGV